MRSTRAGLGMLALSVVCGTASAQAPPVPTPRRVAAGEMPVPVFAQAGRGERLRGALPEVERLFRSWVERQRMPGAVLGVLIDGELAGSYAAGLRDVTARAPVDSPHPLRS